MKSERFLVTCMSNSWGGLEMVAFELACDLKDRGFTVFFAGYTDSILEEKIKQKNISFYGFKEKQSYLSKLLFMRKILKEKAINQIVCQKLPSLKFIVPAAMMVPHKITISGYSHIMIDFNKKDIFHRFLYSKVDKIISLTEIQKKRLLQYLPLREDQIAVIPNWISKEKISQQNQFAKVKKSSSQFTALVASRLDPQKGQDLAIKAVAELRRQGLNIHLWIAGENTKNETDYEKHLKRLTHKLHLENQVHFIGYHEDVLSMMKSVDVLLVPSWEETFGRVIIEAMSVGLPAIASRAGGVPEIIQHEYNGLLFETKNYHDLANKLRLFQTNLVLQQGLKENALRSSELYSQEKLVDAFLQKVSVGA